jgi:putative membrane protein
MWVAATIVAAAVCGAFASSVLACLPGLHVYNLMGLCLLLHHAPGAAGTWVAPEVAVPFFTGLIVGYAFLNTIPSVLLAAPDESALFTVLPGQKLLMAGRGYEAVWLTGIGGAIGLLLLLVVVAPLAPLVLPPVRTVVGPHTHWVLWCVIAFMLMSEWPKGGNHGQGGWRKFLDAWSSLGAGLITFGLSGLLGFVLLFRSPVRADAAFQNLMPAFVGLFGLPGIVMNLFSAATVPPQARGYMPVTGAAGRGAMLRGALAGGLGGGFAAFFPVITGGVGGFLAGHAASLRDDRSFLVSQGVSKFVYYVGGFLFFFVPGLHMTRGGGAALMRGLFVPDTTVDYLMVLASMALAGATALLLLGPLTRLVLGLIGRWGYRRMSGLGGLLMLVIVWWVTGWVGCLIAVTAMGIGLIPVLFGSRRMNGLGVILLPMACAMSGCAVPVVRWLGLV